MRTLVGLASVLSTASFGCSLLFPLDAYGPGSGGGAGEDGGGTTDGEAESSPSSDGGVIDTTHFYDAVMVAAGSNHTCAVRTGGRVACWGLGSAGQIGFGTDDSTVPRAIALPNATAVAAGDGHSCGLDDSGRLFCWGSNHDGQLGTGARDDVAHATPEPVVNASAVPLSGMKAVSTYGFTTCAVGDLGVYCWGNNDYGMLGAPGPSNGVPQLIANTSGATAVSVGGAHVCAVRRTASTQVVCWGTNNSGQLGSSAPSLSYVPIKAEVEAHGITNAIDVRAGESHVCALDAGGAVVCWGGNNDRGELGSLGGAAPSPVPEWSSVMAIGAGTGSSCAVTRDRRVMCIGSNSDGQLGLGSVDLDASSVPHPVPREIPSLHGLGSSISIGDRHVCAVTSNKALFCWGDNRTGQLGDSTKTSRSSPVPVALPQ